MLRGDSTASLLEKRSRKRRASLTLGASGASGTFFTHVFVRAVPAQPAPERKKMGPT